MQKHEVTLIAYDENGTFVELESISSLDYLALLQHSYAYHTTLGVNEPESRLEYITSQVFQFITYDGEKDKLFARKAVEVCEAITNRTTFAYIRQSDENYTWFLVMCNMRFFKKRIEWGSSIRGAWWCYVTDDDELLETCGIWKDGRQIMKLKFSSQEEWVRFIQAVIEFAKPEMVPPTTPTPDIDLPGPSNRWGNHL